MTKSIVFVSSDRVPIPPKYGGATQMYVYGVSKALSKMGLKVHIITLGEADGIYEKNNITFHNFRLDTTLAKSFSALFGLINKANENLPYVTYKILHILRRIEKMYGPIDAIYTHYFTTTVAPILYKKLYNGNLKLIHHYHNEPTPKKCDIWVAKNCDKLYAVSNYVKKQAIKFLKVNESKIKVIYNAINVDEFCYKEETRREIRSKLGIMNNEYVLLYVGRIMPEKGLHVIVQALPQILKDVGNVKLVVIGPLGHYWRLEKKYFNETMLLAAKNATEYCIVYVGFVKPGLEVSKYYSASDVFVFPSFFNEACPSVVLEAMACSLPIVAHNVGGVAELISNEKVGVLIKVGDVEELAKKVSERLTTLEDRNKRGRSRIINKFSFSAVARKLYYEFFS